MPRATMYRTPKDKHERRQNVADIASSSKHGANPKIIVQHCPLLSLPGEILQMIFNMIFLPVVVALGQNVLLKEVESSWLSNTFTLGYAGFPLRYRYDRVRHRAAIIFTCRKLYRLTMPLLYANTAFTINTAKSLKVFLSRSPMIGLAAVQYLGIRQTGYGATAQIEDGKWKARHEQTWRRNYAAVGQRMTSLQYVALDIEVREWPLFNGTNEAWFLDVLQLGMYKYKAVAVNITHPLWSLGICATYAHILEDSLLVFPKTRNDRNNTHDYHGNQFSSFFLNTDKWRMKTADMLALICFVLKQSSKGSGPTYFEQFAQAAGNPQHQQALYNNLNQPRASRSLRIVMRRLAGQQ